jgi:CBS domain-containing protein
MDDKPLLVEDALRLAQYRVYPDTPLSEVVDLMVRRDVRAVPVVGERYEVLGIITSGDALARVLREGPGEAPSPEVEADELTARDVMTRTVLCVSEDQPLMEAANTVVNRDVEQLPVVRDGEFVGFVTRDSILHALHGPSAPAVDNTQERDS